MNGNVGYRQVGGSKLQRTFKEIKNDLDFLADGYKKQQERLEKEKDMYTTYYWESKRKLMKEAEAVCPHENTKYVDTWHPHTGDGDQYYECVVCKHREYV